MSYPYGFGYPSNIQSGTTSGYSGVTEVSSLDEVRAASVPFGVAIYMMNNGNMFYAKNTQGMIKAFKFEEIPIPSNDPQNFVTREEFDKLRSQYDQLIAQQHATATTTIQPTAQSVTNVTTTQYDTRASNSGVLQQSSINEPNQGTSVTVAG